MRLNGLLLACCVGALSTASAVAGGGAGGVWMRSDGEAKVQFAPCGSGMCGTIVWLKRANSPAHVGQQVFFGMGQAGPNRWTGTAHNPEDGNDYDGSMTLSGNRLTTQGCAMGGAICKTVYWIRSR